MEPPGHEQFQDLELWLESKLSKWKQKQDVLNGRNIQQANGVNGHTTRHPPSTENGEEKEAYMKHLSGKYQVWKNMPEKQKSEMWRLELQKALVREQESHHQVAAKLDHAEQEIQHLRAQLSQRNNYQKFPEFAEFIPSTMPLSREALDVLSIDRGPLNWDYEAVISKWKARIHNNRSAQQPLPNISAPNSWSHVVDIGTSTNGASHVQSRRSDRRLHNNGTATDHDVSEDGEDLVDAPGDEDEEMNVQGQNPDDMMMDRQVLDPNLRDHTDVLLKENHSAARVVEGDGFGERLIGLRDYGRVMGNNGDL